MSPVIRSTKFYDAYCDLCTSKPDVFIPLAPRILPLMRQADTIVDLNTGLIDEIKQLKLNNKTTSIKLPKAEPTEPPVICASNERICTMLKELSKIEMDKGDEIRTKVYNKAALAVSVHDKPIMSGDDARKSLCGVGQKIGEKIDKLLKTGKFNIPETLSSLSIA